MEVPQGSTVLKQTLLMSMLAEFTANLTADIVLEFASHPPHISYSWSTLNFSGELTVLFWRRSLLRIFY